MQNTPPFSTGILASVCASCGAPLHGIYCSQCGEKRLPVGGHTLKTILDDWLSAVSHGEGKLLRSLRLLVFKPGFLTREYFLGRRVPYTRPAALFFAANVLYFLLSWFNTFTTPLAIQLSNYPAAQAHIAQMLVAHQVLGDAVPTAAGDVVMGEYIQETLKLADTSQAITAKHDQQLAANHYPDELKALRNYAGRFNARTDILARILVVALVPMLALFLWMTLAWFGHGPPQQIIFAAHFWTAMLLFLIVIGFLVRGINLLSFLLTGHSAATYLNDATVSSFNAIVILVYAYSCLRGFFRFPRLACGVLSLWALVAIVLSIVLYRVLLFYVTFISLRI